LPPTAYGRIGLSLKNKLAIGPSNIVDPFACSYRLDKSIEIGLLTGSIDGMGIIHESGNMAR
jgi:hypothetical protein